VASINSLDQDLNDMTTYLFANALEHDNTNFRISNNKLIINKQPDFEIKKNYKLSIRALDKQGKFIDQIFDIVIQDQNEAPFEIKLSTNNFFENIALNSIVSKNKRRF
jgi:uncharacterized membrane protein YfhO